MEVVEGGGTHSSKRTKSQEEWELTRKYIGGWVDLMGGGQKDNTTYYFQEFIVYNALTQTIQGITSNCLQ